MSTVPGSDVSASGRSNPRHGAVLFGYSSDHRTELLHLLLAEGLEGRIADLADNPAEQAQTLDITVVLVNLSGVARVDGRIIERARKAFPLAGIILTSLYPEENAQLANRLQADDLITYRDKQRLLLAIKRESKNAQLRQDLQEARRELARGEELLVDLLDPSEQASAYLQNGLHISANAAYCHYWGKGPQQLYNLALLDLAASDPESRASLQLALNQAILNGQARNVIAPMTKDHGQAEMEFSGIRDNGKILVRLKAPGHATHPESDACSDRISHATPAAVLAPSSAPFSGSVSPRPGNRELLRSGILYQPIVSLDGETTENYIALPGSTTFDEHLSHADAGGNADPSGCASAFIGEAIEQLAQWDGRNRLHLEMPVDVATADKMLASICDSLRKFKANGRDLYFHVEMSRLQQDKGDLAPILEKFRKINCRIACREVGTNPNLPELLHRHGVRLVHFGNDAAHDMSLESRAFPDFRDLIRRLQELGLRTLIGNVNDRDALMRCWNIGVNYVWGSLFPAPTVRFGSNRPPGRK